MSVPSSLVPLSSCFPLQDLLKSVIILFHLLSFPHNNINSMKADILSLVHHCLLRLKTVSGIKPVHSNYFLNECSDRSLDGNPLRTQL